MTLKSLCGLTADEIYHLIRPFCFSYYHSVAISNSIYKKRTRVISEIISIPKTLKKSLELTAWSGIFDPVSYETSHDKTVKFLFRTNDGKQFETVYIPDNKRNTVCVSTQSGCRIACPLCASGSYGFHGNLSSGEIVNQILSIPFTENITHVVFMGMGEPMDNLENVLKACMIITAEWGLAISPRNVTVSTVGITPGIKRFLEDSECNLTLSLYSPFSEERERFVPVEKKFPVSEILKIMREFRLRKNRRITIAYVMINDLNDSEYHLQELISILYGSTFRVNLLPYHPGSDAKYASSSPERMQYFKHNLIISGISASIRKSRGSDISAACGLLAAGYPKIIPD